MRPQSTPLSAIARRVLSAAQARDSLANRNFVIVALALLGLWLATVLIIEGSHEFWRDEVRAWSLARAAQSPLDLPGLLRTEGHPLLWYVLLYIGKSIVDTPLVLPVVSISVAFAAVAVLMFFSPFPIWMKCLFMFGALPLYEYSVMARNYGISMLLLFIAAALYRYRKTRALLLAFVVALLANTNVHSTLLACLIAALWTWDAAANSQRRPGTFRSVFRSMALPLAIMTAGVLLSAAVAIPPRDSIVTPVYTLGIVDYFTRLAHVMLHPEAYFFEILPVLLPLAIAGGILYLPALGLSYRVNLLLAALGAQIGLGLFFSVVYYGFYKHQGLLLVFLLFLYWIAVDAGGFEAVGKWKRRLFYAGCGALVILLISGNLLRMQALATDMGSAVSASKAFGAFLNGSETYRDAILVPEPDYLIESIPYYAKNEIYLPREHRFGTTVSFTEAADRSLSLGDLLALARDLQTRYGRPVLIVFGHPDVPWAGAEPEAGKIDYSYNKTFSWSAGALRDAAGSLTQVAAFESAGDEQYRIYAIK